MNKLYATANVFSRRWWAYPAWLLLTGLAAYALELGSMGFYWDDWQAVFLQHGGSNSLLWDYFLYDRPFSAWTYTFTFPWLGASPIGWQLLSIILRCLAIWAAVHAFTLVFPSRQSLFRWTGMLTLVYPGFRLQPISVAFSQHWMTFLLFSFSLYAMVSAVRASGSKHWLWLGASLVAAGLSLFTMEYFVMLETLRPILLWWALPASGNRQRLKTTALRFLPYLLLLVVFLTWRFFIYPDQIAALSTQEDPNNPYLVTTLIQHPVATLLRLGNLMIQDTLHLLTSSWLRTIETSSIELRAKMNWLALAVGSLVAAGYAGWTSLQKNGPNEGQPLRNPLRFLAVGLFIVLAGNLPVWLTNRQIIVGKWSDRFTLAPMLGVVLIAVTLVYWLVRTQQQRRLILMLLLALSIAFQVRNTHKYALDWGIQKDFYWQMSWRMPAVEAGTAFFSAKVPSNYSSDYSAGFSLNVLYNQAPGASALPYWYFSNENVGYHLGQLAPDYPIAYQFRNLTFDGNTSEGLAYMYKPASGCLLLLDSAYAGSPALDAAHAALIPLNNPDRIIWQPESSLRDNTAIFGPEPARDWCYAFAHMDHARQQGEWEHVLRLYQTAMEQGFSPKSPVELMPALEASYRLAEWEQTYALSRTMVDASPEMKRYWCGQMARLGTEAGQPSESLLELLNTACPIQK